MIVHTKFKAQSIITVLILCNVGTGKDTKDIGHVACKIGPHMVCGAGFDKMDRTHSLSLGELRT